MRGMEITAPLHDRWCLGSQACFPQNPSRLHGRFCSNSRTLWAALDSHKHVKYGFGSSKISRFNAANFWVSEWCHICRGSGPGNGSAETSPEEDSDRFLDTTPVVKKEGSSSAESHDTKEDDWRAFRARLVVGEQKGSALSDPNNHGEESLTRSFSKRWAHPLPFPETGCLLVATEKLDGQPLFERSVILLLRLGSSKPQDGPFGVILNRPVSLTMKESEPISEKMVQMLQNSRLFYGGPLPADIFLLTRMAEGFGHLEEIMPGVWYGYAHSLQQSSKLAMQDKVLHDIRFYIGYAGWDFNQLRDEIAEGFWWVAACSPDLIKEVPSGSLWHDILVLMGGEYAETVRKSEGEGL